MNGIDFDLLTVPVVTALLIVTAAILIDALLGMILAAIAGEFDFRQMPRFLASNVLPYVGGLLIFALAAHWLPEPYEAVFYPVAAMALVMFLTKIADKISNLFSKK